ncbi:cytochrome c biogenesis thiol:disulfide interchange protein DsbE [Acetobacter nitrogenifigens DSM 23921 = NBRC 105050]|uniref:Thiol:disulfide interchange protein n=1 Tax=Acetobacter nitrogenifigens DSM 23921 = NBRC 105050 TaxID=1120919 RepID=A0A511X9T9_9PROT|nr:redoxin domain-containing protein [Acetobacter nitrogenifigens]GBQ98049.1 cytochrome c biogenesis thiol:disulfide interchange protein DsbE [Acetobacter nitrogenifigens DSM 23921 = NBRC 105050]GEN59710.1 thiol:disulfide interchange protein [Acetobacter nitrogenifigens DSM 23921 = NBRC 105050]
MSAEGPSLGRRRVMMALPLAGAGVVGAAFWSMLSGMQKGSFNPHDINAPSAGRPVPDFTVTDQTPGVGFSSHDLQAITAPVLINFFASWCIPCIAEMPQLLKLRDRLPIWGIAYKDKPDNAAGFLRHAGNPYARIGSDFEGRVAIDWGVSGVPESFLIAPGGKIVWHGAAGLNNDEVQNALDAALGQAKR